MACEGGLVPRFGSELLQFSMPPCRESPQGGEMQPLFFGAADCRAAWVASGQPADEMPALELTDLRTLAYNMEHDKDGKDWSKILLVAPEAGMAFARGERG